LITETKKGVFNVSEYNELAVKQRYGRLPKSKEMILNYGKALKAIIGADGEIAKEEMEALRKGMITMGAPEDVQKAIEDFDYTTVKIESLFPDMKKGGLRAKMLLRDGIDISRADGHYAKEEKEAVAKMAKAVGVDTQTLKSIEALVEMEHSVDHLRKALFPKK
jgi:tellurite resistance protein